MNFMSFIKNIWIDSLLLFRLMWMAPDSLNFLNFVTWCTKRSGILTQKMSSRRLSESSAKTTRVKGLMETFRNIQLTLFWRLHHSGWIKVCVNSSSRKSISNFWMYHRNRFEKWRFLSHLIISFYNQCANENSVLKKRCLTQRCELMPTKHKFYEILAN